MKIRKSLQLKPIDKVLLADLSRKWLSENHPKERTIFSDEKWFSIDGPDDWRSYVKKKEKKTPEERLWYHGVGHGATKWSNVISNTVERI